MQYSRNTTTESKCCLKALMVGWAVLSGAPKADAGESCDRRIEICFQGIGHLQGGGATPAGPSSFAGGVAYSDGMVVVSGSSTSTAAAAHCPTCTEAVIYTHGELQPLLDTAAEGKASIGGRVALSDGRVIVTGRLRVPTTATPAGFINRAYRAETEGSAFATLQILPVIPIPGFATQQHLVGHAISDDGEVIVGSVNQLNVLGDVVVHERAFRWTRSTGTSVLLPRLEFALQNPKGQGLAVSPNGVFAGGRYALTDRLIQGFIHPGPGLFCAIISGIITCPSRGIGGLLGGGGSSQVNAITNTGLVLATGNPGVGQMPFFWFPGGFTFPPTPDIYIPLGRLRGEGETSVAQDMSGDGTLVIGTSSSEFAPTGEVFLWHTNFGMRSLRDLVAENGGAAGLEGWTLTQGIDMSTNGLAICGNGINSAAPGGGVEGWFMTLPDCNGNSRWDGLEAPIPSARAPRSVLEFDGIDDFAERAVPSTDLRTAGPFTIEAWVRLQRLGVTQSIVTMGEAGEDLASNILYSIEVDATGDIVVTHERSNFADVSVIADTNLETNRWYHLAVTRTFVTESLLEYAVYIDNLDPIVEGAAGAPAGGTSGRLRIGRAAGVSPPDRPFDGFISDVRIWNTVRSADQIRGSMLTSTPEDTTGLLAAWRMDEPSGTTLDDSIGGNDLTVSGNGVRQNVDADCNVNRIPDSCETDCNDNGIPDDCDIRDASSRDCDLNGRPDVCDTQEALAELLNQDRAAAEVFREERNDPTSGTTFGTMIQKYGRPWKPGTGQTPGGGVCSGGDRRDLACAGTTDCPGGSCVPPVRPGIEQRRDPAERLRVLIADPSCVPMDVVQRILEELFSFEMLLGNEAFADALDPTVGVGSDNDPISLEQVPGRFAFRELPGINSLLEEELALLRGREIALPLSPNSPFNDEPAANPNGNYPQFETATRAAIYNRLRPNATDAEDSVGYRTNYGDPPNNATASENFPQGHGDALGYYLSATKFYLDVFGAEKETPVPSEVSRAFVESQLVPEGSVDCSAGDCETIVDDDGAMHHVGFQSVRNMVAAMAAKARSANRIVDLTFRRDYREDTDTRLKDTDAARAWATADWARRGGLGAYFDWAVANHLLPVPEEGAADAIESVHRQRVDEVRLLTSAVEEMQERVDAAGVGLNPLGLVANVVPFRIIQPGQLLDFLQGGSSAGQSHYGIVRNAALEAIKNARGILKRANLASNRLRGNEQMFTDFENQVRQTDVGLSDRLIEIFGLPSVSDAADNDSEDNDGDGVQLTFGVNDSDDDFLEAGCNGECAGSPDLVSFLLDEEAFKELRFVARGAVGQVQLAMFEMRVATLKVQLAQQAIANLEALIQDKAENVALVRQEQIATLRIRSQACDELRGVIDRKDELARAREQSATMMNLITGIVTSGSGSGLSLIGKELGGLLADPSGTTDDQFDFAREELRINCWQTAQLANISNEQEFRKLEIELEDLIRRTPLAILDLAVADTQVRQALAVVRKGFQEGKRLKDERDRNRRVQSDKLQQFRFRDMAFRSFRNQALEQYGAFFDLAGRYVMLAARAFAYEYNERDEVSEQMQRLHRERLLGTESAADQGLESIIARLDQKRQESDFVARLQKLSLFDHDGDEFSLRKNLMGLAINSSEDSDQQQFEKNKAFRALLESHIVQELNDVPAFRQLASFDSDRDAGPALVLSFSTEVGGRTLFGQTRGTTFGAPANFDTCSNPKLFEFAILLEGVDNPGAIGVDSPLIFAHFLPVGSCMLRAPESGNCAFRAVRTWEVVDQRIPGVSAAYRDSGGAVLDSFAIPRLATSPELSVINRFPVTQAQIRTTENPVFQDDLAGWSVWNTQWLLAIPGRQFASPGDDADVVRRKLLILIFDANESGNPRSPDENLGIDDIKLRIKAYGKPS